MHYEYGHCECLRFLHTHGGQFFCGVVKRNFNGKGGTCSTASIEQDSAQTLGIITNLPDSWNTVWGQ